MDAPFTNIHTHVFNSECAPENFLRIMDIKFVRKHPKKIKAILQNRKIRRSIWYINSLFKRKIGKRRSGFEKYISFLNVGTQNSQLDIYKLAIKVAKSFDPSARIIGLTMDMDHMDNQGKKPEKSLNTQLEEVKHIKRFASTNFFPFLGIDPRSRSGNDLVEWARSFFERGFNNHISGKAYPYFSGVKLYPALGFFPFDPRLEEFYDYAEKSGIPIIAHCTRSGSQYVGSQIESLIPRMPAMIMPGKTLNKTFNTAIEIQQEIYKRIDLYYKKEWIKNNSIGKNDLACDLFSHPGNYVPIMLKFPRLKICLAHMGGTDEMIRMGDKVQNQIWKVDPVPWPDLIRELMKDYLNLFTDISYSLSYLNNEIVRKNIQDWLEIKDLDGQPLGNRVLFGTDYYMTEQESNEMRLYDLTQRHLTLWLDNITRDNPERFLN